MSNPRMVRDASFWERSRMVQDVLGQIGRRADEIKVGGEFVKKAEKSKNKKMQAKKGKVDL